MSLANFTACDVEGYLSRSDVICLSLLGDSGHTFENDVVSRSENVFCELSVLAHASEHVLNTGEQSTEFGLPVPRRFGSSLVTISTL